MSNSTPSDLAAKAEAMLAFRHARDSGLPVPADIRARHLWATNDGYTTGPEAGEQVPDFTLPDASGRLRSLANLAGPNGLLLIFFRSAHWCQYCRSQLVELEQSRSMLEKNGVNVAAISIDSPEILHAFTKQYSIGYPLLSDAGCHVIQKFGILNQNFAVDAKVYGIPHPVEYLITPDGTVVRKYSTSNFQQRVAASAVALREFGEVARDAPAINIESGALAVQIGFSSAKVFAAQKVSFYAAFALQPGWHVYGALAATPTPATYAPTSIAFDDPAVLRCDLILPKPVLLELPALGEKLPLYSGSFRAIGTVLFNFPLPQGPLLLHGRLHLQQCSDTICEPPQSIPFECTLQVEAFVLTEEAKRLANPKQKKD